MVSDRKMIIVNLKSNIIQLLCLQTGRRTNIENYLDKITDEVNLFVFTSTKLFCIEEIVPYYTSLTYFPFEENCPFGEKAIFYKKKLN